MVHKIPFIAMSVAVSLSAILLFNAALGDLGSQPAFEHAFNGLIQTGRNANTRDGDCHCTMRTKNETGDIIAVEQGDCTKNTNNECSDECTDIWDPNTYYGYQVKNDCAANSSCSGRLCFFWDIDYCSDYYIGNCTEVTNVCTVNLKDYNLTVSSDPCKPWS